MVAYLGWLDLLSFSVLIFPRVHSESSWAQAYVRVIRRFWKFVAYCMVKRFANHDFMSGVRFSHAYEVFMFLVFVSFLYWFMFYFVIFNDVREVILLREYFLVPSMIFFAGWALFLKKKLVSCLLFLVICALTLRSLHFIFSGFRFWYVFGSLGVLGSKICDLILLFLQIVVLLTFWSQWQPTYDML